MWRKKVRLALPEWNRRILTEIDFQRFCENQSVKIVEVVTGESGLYVVRYDQPFIVLDPALSNEMRLWVRWHEAAHHILHVPREEYFKVENTKEQWQANAVAACAMIPQTLLRKQHLDEIRSEYGYPTQLCNIRRAVLMRYGL